MSQVYSLNLTGTAVSAQLYSYLQAKAKSLGHTPDLNEAKDLLGDVGLSPGASGKILEIYHPAYIRIRERQILAGDSQISDATSFENIEEFPPGESLRDSLVLESSRVPFLTDEAVYEIISASGFFSTRKGELHILAGNFRDFSAPIVQAYLLSAFFTRLQGEPLPFVGNDPRHLRTREYEGFEYPILSGPIWGWSGMRKNIRPIINATNDFFILEEDRMETSLDLGGLFVLTRETNGEQERIQGKLKNQLIMDFRRSRSTRR